MMGTSRRPSITDYILVFAISATWTPSLCQVGLRTLPLTDSRNRTSLNRFSKWGDNLSSNPNLNAPSVEMELAAILHDLANGVVLTEPSTKTSVITTSTTHKPIIKTNIFDDLYESGDIQPPSSIPVSPLWEGERNNAKQDFEDKKESKEQQNFFETPKIVESNSFDYVNNNNNNNNNNYNNNNNNNNINNNNNNNYNNKYNEEIEETEEVEGNDVSVIRSNYGVNEIPWITELGVLWPVHVYTTAGFFSLLVLFSLYCLTRIYLSTQLLPKGYYITVHLLVFLAAFFRCVFFFHDPYAVSRLLPDGLSNILFNTGTPCIITALAVLILALLRTARLIILPLNLQSPVVVAIISGVLLAGSIIIDIFGGLISEDQVAPGLKAVIQALTAGWGSALSIGYVIVYIRIEKAGKRQQNEIARLTFSRHNIEGSLPHRFPKSSLIIGARLTLIASLSGLILTVLQVYGLINSDLVFNLPPIKVWVWFTYQTSCRILEIIMWSSVCIASALPANFNKNDRSKTVLDEGQFLTVLSCKSCNSCSNISSCCIYEKHPTDDMYSTICQTNHIARNFGIQGDGKLIPQDTIAYTDNSPKHISTTLLHPKNKNFIKTSTLHSLGTNGQLLWDNHANLNSSLTTSRPSSLILTEGGVIKFRTHDPHNDMIRILNYPKRDGFNQTTDMQESQKKILENLENCTNTIEDNYINSGALTPEEKRIIEKSILNGEMPCLYSKDGANEMYADYADQNKEVCSPYKYPKYAYTDNTSNFNESNRENAFYQYPSFDSSMESGGHIYASIQQPLNEIHFGLHNSQSDGNKTLQGKILNNSDFSLQNSSHYNSSSFSNKSQLDVIATDYLTDGSHDTGETPNSDRRHCMSSPNEQSYNKSVIPTESSYQNYCSPISQQLDYKNQRPAMHSNEKNSCDGIYSNGGENKDTYFNDTDCQSSQKKKFFYRHGNAYFEKVSYSPLQADDDQYSETYEEKNRPNTHRPRKLRTPNSPNKSHELQNGPQNLKEGENFDFNSPCISEEDKRWLSQKLLGSDTSYHGNLNFQPNTNNGSGINNQTDEKFSQSLLSEHSDQISDPLSSKSKTITGKNESREKSAEVRWPINCTEVL